MSITEKVGLKQTHYNSIIVVDTRSNSAMHLCCVHIEKSEEV